jgi:hypothetical protein
MYIASEFHRRVAGMLDKNGEPDGEWELRRPNSAGQSFALSGHMATRRAQTSASEARMGLLPQAPDIAAHRREITRQRRERQRAGVLEAAASTLEDGAQLARGTRAWLASDVASGVAPPGPLAAERLPA